MPAPSSALLEPGYLLRNFRRVAKWVNTLYPDLLTPEEQDCQQAFQTLSDAAQSLCLRLLTRTRPLVPVASLHYAEVPDVHGALQELITAGFVALNPAIAADILLTQQTRLALTQWFGIRDKAATSKAAITARILQQFSESEIQGIIAREAPYVSVTRRAWFDLFLLLFFGNGRQDLSEFVITELGHVQYEPYRIDTQNRYFSCRENITTLQAYLAAREQLEDRVLLQDASALQSLFASLPQHGRNPELQRRFDKLTLAIARQLERLDVPDIALQIYRHTTQHPAMERQVRILEQQNRTTEAFTLCQELLTSHHPQAQEFAEQFSRRLARKLKIAPPAPTAAPVITTELVLPWSDAPVEYLAASALSDAQHRCFYVENTLFCGLFGLLFWDIVYAPVPGAFFHPFQRGPKHLHSEFFYADRAGLIEQRLQQMTTPGWQAMIWQMYSSRQGIANPFVVWEALNQPLLEQALSMIPAHHMQAIFRQLAQHPGLYGSGFPDLIRFDDSRYELIEVKAPHDRLQPNQRRWFRRFAEIGIPARQLNVKWLTADHD